MEAPQRAAGVAPAKVQRPASPLSLFTGGEELARSRLAELFEAVYWPYLVAERGSAPRNADAYREMLRHWSRLTDDPPLAEITRETLLAFRMALRSVKGRKAPTLSPRTVHKVLRQLRALLAFFGPADGAHPDAIAVIAEPPRMRLPTPPKATAQHVTGFAELQAMLKAAPRMTRPARGLPCRRGDWWIAFLLTLYVTGWRIGSVLRLEWTDLAGDVLHLRADANTKSHTADAKRLPQVVLAAIAKVRPFTTPAGTAMFPWPHCLRYLYDAMDRLQALAGIPVDRRRWMKFHGLRKRHAVEAEAIGGLGAAQMSLGHTSARTTIDHYLPRDEATADMIARLPLPDVPRDDGQLRLFDC